MDKDLPIKKVTSCGIILFRKFNENIEFLLINSKFHGFWSFPKGRKEEGEYDLETALREVQEEVGIPKEVIKIIPSFKEKTHYSYYHAGKIHQKTVIWYLGELLKDYPVSIDNYEISDYVWLSFDEALEKLTFDKDKDILKKAYNIILNN